MTLSPQPRACALVLLLSLSVSACCESESEAPPATPAATPAAPAAPAKPQTYAANVTEGFKFSTPGYPNFLSALTGLSHHEDWGRWSEGKVVALQFAKPLPTHFTLALTARAFGPNMGAPVLVKAGAVEQRFTPPDGADHAHSLEFKLDAPTNRLEFHIPKPTSPAELNASTDSRLLGIGFVSLQITPLP